MSVTTDRQLSTRLDRPRRPGALVLRALLAGCGAAALSPAAWATVTLSGTYSDNPADSGYTATASDLYVVTPSATFNNNFYSGLTTFFDASIQVDGGTFQGNRYSGIQVLSTAGTATVNGGLFDGNGAGLDFYGVLAIVNGGTFSNNSGYGIESHTATTIQGGTFKGNGTSGSGGADLVTFDSTGIVNVYGGVFQTAAAAKTFIASDSSTINLYGIFSSYGTLTGTGTFTGTLANEAVAQSFSYATQSDGQIILHAVPEPATWALLLVGIGVVGARGRRPRTRSSA